MTKERTRAGEDRRVVLSLSLPIGIYLKLADQAEANGQTLSSVINRLINMGLEQEAEACPGPRNASQKSSAQRG